MYRPRIRLYHKAWRLQDQSQLSVEEWRRTNDNSNSALTISPFDLPMHPAASDRLRPDGADSVRDPSKLSFQSDRTRRSILGAYWLVIFLALPLWWHTTSIERLSLPSSRVFTQAETELQFPVHVELDEAYFGANVASIANTLQDLLSAQSAQSPHLWKGVRVHVRGGWTTG
jgi:Phosphatidylinositol-glycan biosynthesis class S protein